MGLAVGIDLGTTNSVVAISQGGRPRVIAGEDGSPLIPSVVSFHPNGQTLVGNTARARRAVDPGNTVFSVKRLLGRPFASEEVRRAKSRFAFELREGPDAAVLVHTRNGDLSLPEISALVLREIRRVAEGSLGERVDRAVVTVPANFNELQRTATKISGQIADLDVIRILNEPTAAALAYGYGRAARERIAVYDFGGGTFDVTLLELSGNVFEVLATAGDTFLGGDDIDLLVTENLADALLQTHRIDARNDMRAYELLRAAAEQAKIDLSSTDTATIRIPEIGYAPGGRGIEFRTRITRAELEQLSAPLVNRTFDVCAEALKLAGMHPSECGTVILVGGSSRIPAVRHGVARFFGRDPLTTLPPEQVVGMGASILAEALTGSRKAAAPLPERQRTSTLRPENAPPTPGASQRPSALRVPTQRPSVTTQSSQRPGPAIRARPTDDETTTAVLQQRQRSTTNPGVQPSLTAPQPGDLTWGSLHPPANPSRPPNTADYAQAPLDADSMPFDDETRPRISAPPGTLPDIDASMIPSLDQFDAETTPGSNPFGSPPAPISPQRGPLNIPSGVRTQAMQAAVEAPRAFEPAIPRPPGAPGDSLFTGIPGLALSGDDNTTSIPAVAPQGSPFRGATMPLGAGGNAPSRIAPSHAPSAFAATLTDSTAFAIPGVSPQNPSSQMNAPAMPGASQRGPSAQMNVPAAPGASARMPSAQMNVPAAPGASARMPSAQMGNAMPGPSARMPSAQMGGAMPGPSARMPSAQMGGAMPGPSARMPSSQMGGAMPGQSTGSPSLPPVFGMGTPSGGNARPPAYGASPGASMRPPTMPPAVAPGAPRTGNTGMGRALPGVPARPPSLPPGQLGLPSIPPPQLPLLLDVTPHTLSIETVGGMCESVIPRNATIPVEQTREFATAYDGQESVRIRISQGESRRFGENQALGELELSGIPRASRGDVKIAVTFELDADGTLQVRAREVSTGQQTQTRVTLLTMPTAGDMAAMAQRQRTQA